MVLRKYPLYLIPISTALFVGIGAIAPVSPQVKAQSQLPAIAQSDVPTNWNVFDTPEGAPGRRIGGGTRGSCPKRAEGTIALVPESNLGRTIAEYPTLLFYVPQISQPGDPPSNIAIEFTLVDESDPVNVKEIYSSRVPMPAEAGTIAFSVPDNGEVPPLATDKLYNWYFSLICNPSAREPSILALGGWIERIEPSETLATELEATDPNDRSKVYERELLWFDSIATVAELLTENPNNITARVQWKKLLREVDLAEVSEAPIVTVGQGIGNRE